MFFLEVKPFTEEFVQAQSQAMGGGGQSTQIDALIAAQKEIINATWNLERRSAAGRSAEDIKAVGDAQAELKTRAEQIAGGARRGGRGFVPQQILPPRAAIVARSGRDPVAEAIAAMGRAVEQLHGTQTADALPHEMAALQGLLQAQAEVRRRQVMQQSASAGGGGGTSRSDRDLSALFDRELQRQQRTNYETPRATTETPERQEGDLLDRIRELARRQEELARRQRELAEARLDAEEMKRQLERLSREQQELRQQADALQKQSQGGGARRPGLVVGRARQRVDAARGRADAERRERDAAAECRRRRRQRREGGAGPQAARTADARLERQRAAAHGRRDAARSAADRRRAAAHRLRDVAARKGANRRGPCGRRCGPAAGGGEGEAGRPGRRAGAGGARGATVVAGPGGREVRRGGAADPGPADRIADARVGAAAAQRSGPE